MTLNERIDAAIKRITSGHGAMRIPAEDTDPDLVLMECRDEIAALRARVAYLEGELHETIGENADLVVRAEKAEAELARLTSPVPGLAESGPYTAADVAAIEAHRGKPYERLRATVAERDALRAQVAAARAFIEDDTCRHDSEKADVLRAMDEAKP
jgi:hypothetical protein